MPCRTPRFACSPEMTAPARAPRAAVFAPAALLGAQQMFIQKMLNQVISAVQPSFCLLAHT